MGFFSFVAGTVGTLEFLRWSASSRGARGSSRSWSWGDALRFMLYLVILPFYLSYYAARELTKPENWAEERWRVYVLQFACPPVGWYGLCVSQSIGPLEKICIAIGWMMLVVLSQYV